MDITNDSHIAGSDIYSVNKSNSASTASAEKFTNLMSKKDDPSTISQFGYAPSEPPLGYSTSGEVFLKEIGNYIVNNGIESGYPASFAGGAISFGKGGKNTVLAVDLFSLNPKKAFSKAGNTFFVSANIDGNKLIGTADGYNELSLGQPIPLSDADVKNLIDKMGKKFPSLRNIKTGDAQFFANFRETCYGVDVKNLTPEEFEAGKRAGALKPSLNIGIIVFAERELNKEVKKELKHHKFDNITNTNKNDRLYQKSIGAYTDILMKKEMRNAKAAFKGLKTTAEIATSLNLATAPIKAAIKYATKEGLKEGTKEWSSAVLDKLKGEIRENVEERVKKELNKSITFKPATGLALKIDLPAVTDTQRAMFRDLSKPANNFIDSTLGAAEYAIPAAKAAIEVTVDEVEEKADKIAEQISGPYDRTVKFIDEAIDSFNETVDEVTDTYKQAEKFVEDVTNNRPSI